MALIPNALYIVLCLTSSGAPQVRCCCLFCCVRPSRPGWRDASRLFTAALRGPCCPRVNTCFGGGLRLTSRRGTTVGNRGVRRRSGGPGTKRCWHTLLLPGWEWSGCPMLLYLCTASTARWDTCTEPTPPPTHTHMVAVGLCDLSAFLPGDGARRRGCCRTRHGSGGDDETGERTHHQGDLQRRHARQHPVELQTSADGDLRKTAVALPVREDTIFSVLTLSLLSTQVVPGETALAFYRAKNPTDKPIIGISTYNVVPFDAGQYFNKIQASFRLLSLCRMLRMF